MHNTHGLRLAAVAQDDFTRGRTGSVHQPLDFERGVDVGIDAVAVIRIAPGVVGLKSRGHDDRSHLDDFLLRFLAQIDGVAVAASFNARLLALPGLELDACLRVDDGHQGNGLRKRHVNRPPLAEPVVKLVWHLGLLVDASVDAFQAANAQGLVNIPRPPRDGDLVAAHVAFESRHVRIRPKSDIRMVLYRGHLGREDAGGAVQGREGLIEARHVAADAGFPFDQVYVLSRVG